MRACHARRPVMPNAMLMPSVLTKSAMTLQFLRHLEEVTQLSEIPREPLRHHELNSAHMRQPRLVHRFGNLGAWVTGNSALKLTDGPRSVEAFSDI
jgi:hypothetical protein